MLECVLEGYEFAIPPYFLLLCYFIFVGRYEVNFNGFHFYDMDMSIGASDRVNDRNTLGYFVGTPVGRLF